MDKKNRCHSTTWAGSHLSHNAFFEDLDLGSETFKILERTLSHSPSKYNFSIAFLFSLLIWESITDKACSNFVGSGGGYAKFNQAKSRSDGLSFFRTSKPSSHSSWVRCLKSLSMSVRAPGKGPHVIQIASGREWAIVPDQGSSPMSEVTAVSSMSSILWYESKDTHTSCKLAFGMLIFVKHP